MTSQDRDFFAQNGFINLGRILDDEDVSYFQNLFD